MRTGHVPVLWREQAAMTSICPGIVRLGLLTLNHEP